MTYEESYRSCKTKEEFKEMLENDLWIAACINPDRERVILDAAQKVADERGWIVKEEIKTNILSKDELATILWALDYRMDNVLHENSIDEEDLVAQKKLYEQLNKVYLKVHEMWEKTNTSCEFCEEEIK